MRYPYERFIVFLISRRVDVNEVLEKIELPPVGSMGIADRKQKIRDTAPASIIRYLGQGPDNRSLLLRDGILDWAESCGIRELWERQREFGRRIVAPLEAASNIFLNPHARTVLGTLILADAEMDEIGAVMREQFSMETNVEIVEFYRNIFWDVEAMGRRAWGDFMASLHDDQRQIVALGVRGLKPNDIRYAIGAEIKSDPRDVLQNILNDAHHQFRQAMASSSPAAHGAFKWADLALRVCSTMRSAPGFSAVTSGETEGRPEVATSMFSILVEEPKIVTLDDLDGELSKVKTALDQAMENESK